MQDNSVIHFIKPCRRFDEGPRQLTPAYARAQAAQGRVVQVNLDNCSLQRMERLPEKPRLEDAEAVGLLPLVELLQNAPLALTAIGLDEMPDRWVGGAINAYQRFCAAFWTGHQDDAEATQRTFDPLSTARTLQFDDLPEGSRLAYGGAYVALLQMQRISHGFPAMADAKKFEAYLHSIIGSLNIVSAFELEIAKYAFWTPAEPEVHRLPDRVRSRRRDIAENFTKLQRSVEKCRSAALNGAIDLYWLSGANLAEDIGLSLGLGEVRLPVDAWVGTNDVKLYRICEDIHSVSGYASTMMRLATAREPEMSRFRYWSEVDRMSKDVMLYRAQTQTDENQDRLGRIDAAAALLEGELRQLLAAGNR